MPEKKNQHFVPRFYLKYFSNNFKGKTLGIYNFSDDKYIPNGGLYNQAANDYFYGEDLKVENAFGEIETETSILLKFIFDTGTIPAYMSEAHLLLLVFVLSLSSRTEQAADSQNELLDKTIKKIFKDDPRVKGKLDDFEIAWSNAVLTSLQVAMRSTPILFDLKFKFLVNSTQVPFITSDHPVIKYNQFLERLKPHGGITGLAQKGLQIFLPFHPQLYIVFYDSNVYGVGHKKESMIEVNNEKDVDSLNVLQLVNAHKNLYFNEAMDKAKLEKLLSKGLHLRKNNLAKVLEYKSTIQDERRSLLHMYINDTKIALKLSFIRELKKVKSYDAGNNVVHIRNQELLDMLEKDSIERARSRKKDS